MDFLPFSVSVAFHQSLHDSSMATRVQGRAVSRLLSLFWVQDVLGFITGTEKVNTAFPQSPIRDQHDCSAVSLGSSSSRLRGGVLIPGSKQKIWYTMAVESTGWSCEEYQNRAKFVIGELHKAVDFHEILCDRADQVAYDLRMVGTSPETATPTIVVKCKKEDSRALRALFADCAHQRLNCTMDSDHPRRPRKTNSPSQPHFKLVIFSRDADPVTRLAASDITITPQAGQPTFCGSLVRSQGRTATVGLSLQVGGVDRLLTVEHLFDSRPSSSGAVRDASSDTLRRAQPVVNLPPSSAYLDWTLIEPAAAVTGTLSHNQISPAPNSSPIRLAGIATEPRHQETPVYMVSGVNGVRSGILLRGVSYICSQRGRALCPVWTMVPTSGAIEKGECGSIIVDQKTSQVYGHLVGADEDLGFAYIVPLQTTIEQIKTAFNTDHVVLSGTTSSENKPGDEQTYPECVGREKLSTLFSQVTNLWNWYTFTGFLAFHIAALAAWIRFRSAGHKPGVLNASQFPHALPKPGALGTLMFDTCASRLESILKLEDFLELSGDTISDYLYTGPVTMLNSDDRGWNRLFAPTYQGESCSYLYDK